MAETKAKPPIITPDLIAYLDSLYPDRSPELSKTLDEIRFNSGQASVVRHLKFIMDQQSQNILKG